MDGYSPIGKKAMEWFKNKFVELFFHFFIIFLYLMGIKNSSCLVEMEVKSRAQDMCIKLEQ